MVIKVKKIDYSINNPMPKYATENSSGMDISSSSMKDIVINPMETGIVPTNLIIEIPVGFEGQIRPRSGLALKHNIGIINSPGTIDADYRGELKILLTNFGKETFIVKFGERIAQLVICKVEKVKLEIVEDIKDTERSSGGFGHTGS
jgi:dUTP pyrophosphatase